MAITGTLTLSGTLSGYPSGTRTFGLSWTITTGVETVVVDLANGTNTITVPTGTTLAIITPPSGNSATITAKGVAGDTGIALKKTLPTVLALDTTVATFVLSAGGAIPGTEITFA